MANGYNIGFRINDILMEVTVVRDLLIAGYEVKRISKNCYSVIGVEFPWLTRIEKYADKFWYF